MERLLLIPITLVVGLLSRLLSHLGYILARHHTVKHFDLSASLPPVPEKREEILEYMRAPAFEAFWSYLKIGALYHMIFVLALLDGFFVFLGVTLQIPDLWWVFAFMMALFTFMEFMACRSAYKAVRSYESGEGFESKPDGELRDFAVDARRAYQELRDPSSNAGEKSWRILCYVSLALVLLLGGLQARYLFAVREVEPGVFQRGGYQYRMLEDGTAEIVRYTGIWRKITVPSSFRGAPVASVGEEAFWDPGGDYKALGRKDLTEVILPDSLTQIGNRAFKYCSDLESLVIPAGVTRIGAEAFSGCFRLKTLELPEGLRSIGDGAFSGCGVRSMTLPASVTELGANPFSDCDELFVAEDNPVFCMLDGALCTREDITLLWYPSRGAGTVYRVPDGIRGIGNEAFQSNYQLERVILPEGLESIGDRAFYSCSKLSEVVFPEGLRSIGEYAFSDCSGLTAIELPNGLTSLGDSAFSWCKALRNATLPDSLTEIGESAFSYCSSLHAVVLPGSLTVLPEGMFYECEALTEVTLPEGLTKIGEFAFNDCTALERVSFPDGLEKIESGAFYNCKALRELDLPESLREIGNVAFAGCSSLEEVRLPEGIRVISPGTFSGCSRLRRVDIPASVTEIQYRAFLDCSSLSEIVIPASVEDISLWEAFPKTTVLIVTPGSFAWLYCQKLGLTFRYAEDSAA